MYSFVSGCLEFWKPHVRGRVRFAPVPRAWILDGVGGTWVEIEPPHLWIRTATPRRHRLLRKVRGARGVQMELAFPLSAGGDDLPPRPRPHAATARLWKQVPSRWRKLLKPITHSPWRCLLFLHHLGKPAEDLFVSNLGLAWLIANKIDPSDWRCIPDLRESLLRRLAGKQVKLLSFLDLPEEKWVVKLLGKLEATLSPEHTLKNLRQALRYPEAHKGFQHLENIRNSHLCLVEPLTAPLLNPGILREVGQYPFRHPDWQWALKLLRDVGGWHARGTVIPKCARIYDMYRWALGEQERNQQRCKIQQLDREAFPSPPFPGDPIFVHIRHPLELLAEGGKMKHCVARYHPHIVAGRFCVYALHGPERATLGIQRKGPHTWEVFDLKLSCNRAPSSATVERVREWLREGHARLRCENL